MATSDNSIREFVQGQYAVLLLDHVAEFKSDFIRIIFEEALLGELLEKKSPLQKRLAQFFLKLDGDQLVKQFETWHKTIKHRSGLDCTHDFEREKQFLKALPQLVNQCVKHFKNTWISAAAHDEALARQLAKGFLHGEWFCRQLFPTTHQRSKGKGGSLKNNFRKSPSLGWLFQAMLFAATPVGPQTNAQKGKLHLILPQLLKNEEEVDDSKEAEFERCFPVKNRSSFVLGTSFLLALINALEVEAKSLKSEEDCPPVFPVGETSSGSEKIGVLTGLTTLFYDTSFSTGTDAFEKKFARLSYLFGNCNCIQFLPRPDKTHYGAFQLQSCVPGLIQAIWPAVVEKDEIVDHSNSTQSVSLGIRFAAGVIDAAHRDGIASLLRMLEEFDFESLTKKHLSGQLPKTRKALATHVMRMIKRAFELELEPPLEKHEVVQYTTAIKLLMGGKDAIIEYHRSFGGKETAKANTSTITAKIMNALLSIDEATAERIAEQDPILKKAKKTR